LFGIYSNASAINVEVDVDEVCHIIISIFDRSASYDALVCHFWAKEAKRKLKIVQISVG